MTIDWLHLIHQTLFGGIAAMGFGVLFNFNLRHLWWCFLAGCLALGTRTLGQDMGWSLEGASLLAAGLLATVCVVFFRNHYRTTGTNVILTGCIPMVPGSFFAQGILGLFAITAPHVENVDALANTSLQFLLRASFTVLAIGAGITVPPHIFRTRD